MIKRLLQTFHNFYLQKFASYKKILYLCERFGNCLLFIVNPTTRKTTSHIKDSPNSVYTIQ